MPVLGKEYQQQVQLPGYPEDAPAILTIISNPQGKVLTDIPQETDGEGVNDCLLSKIIVSWNFVDEAGQPLPVNTETVGKLGEISKIFLLKALGLMDVLPTPKKNKSSATS